MASPLTDLFDNDPRRVAAAVEQALDSGSTALDLPDRPAATGIEPEEAIALVTPYLRGAGRALGDPGFLAHMDPPTPWVAWVMALVGASSNQNLLHPDTAPAARQLEERVVAWLSPIFGMEGGHLVPGSTVANLTALWAARDLTGADTVVASSHAHLSIRKAAAILGLRFLAVEPAAGSALTGDDLGPVFRSADGGEVVAPEAAIVVPTAGTTGSGAIDQLDLGQAAGAAWVHVDAAWAGPLRLSSRHRHCLDGLDEADSVAVSAHKWLYQPKESALLCFADVEAANRAISVGGAYLQVPNVGLLGSHGTAAAPLAATMLTLGLDGLAALVDEGMAIADRLAELVDAHPRLELHGPNTSGVVAWRHRTVGSSEIRARLEGAFVSTVEIDGTTWLRSVAANPMADPTRVVDAVLRAAGDDPIVES